MSKYSAKFQRRTRELNWAKFQVKGMKANTKGVWDILLLSDNVIMEQSDAGIKLEVLMLLREANNALRQLEKAIEKMRDSERHADAHRIKEEE